MKKITLDITKPYGDRWEMLVAFRNQARSEGWDERDITRVTNKALSRDNDHLLQTIMQYTN